MYASYNPDSFFRLRNFEHVIISVPVKMHNKRQKPPDRADSTDVFTQVSFGSRYSVTQKGSVVYIINCKN